MQPFSRTLIYFVEVARQGSVRKASEKLNVSASAIDRQILVLEDGIGVTLFSRFPGGMRLTAAGELLLRGALEWRRDFRMIREQIDELSGLRRGHVRLVVIEALVRGVLPGVLAKMRATWPGVRLEIDVLPNERIGEALGRGEFDAGLFLNPQSSKDIAVRAFREIALGVVTPAGHPLREASQLRFTHLAGETVIRPLEPLEIAEQFVALETSSGLKIDAALASNNISMIKSMAIKGLGVTVMSLLDVAAEVAEGALQFIPLTDKAPRPATLALCHPRQGHISNAAALLLQMIEETPSWT